MVNLFKTIFNDANTKAEIPCVGSVGGIGYALYHFVMAYNSYQDLNCLKSGLILNLLLKIQAVVFTGEGKFDKHLCMAKDAYRVIELCKKFSKKLYIVGISLYKKQNTSSNLKIKIVSLWNLEIQIIR